MYLVITNLDNLIDKIAEIRGKQVYSLTWFYHKNKNFVILKGKFFIFALGPPICLSRPWPCY